MDPSSTTKTTNENVEKASTSAAETGSQSQATLADQMMANFTTAMLVALRQVKGESNSSTKITPHAKLSRYFSPGQNFRSWLSQLTQYIDLVKIPEAGREVFLVTLLDQHAY